MIRKNIIANFAGTALIGVITVLALAQYVKIYGLERWGYIAGVIVFINILMIAELGITQIYVVEYSKAESKHAVLEKYFNLMLTIGTLIGGVVAISAVLLRLCGVESIVVFKDWGLLLAGLVLYVLNFLNNFIYVHLAAAQKQIELNSRQVIFVFFKAVTILLVATFITREPLLYFIIFLVYGALELYVNMRMSQDESMPPLRLNIGYQKSIDLIKDIRGISLGVVIGIVATNVDRLYISWTADAVIFGAYSVVVSVAMYFMQLQYPVMKAFFPAVAKAIHDADRLRSRRTFMFQVSLVNVIIVPPLLIACLFDEQILNYFSLQSAMGMGAGGLFKMLLLCVYINAIYHVLYQRMLILRASRQIAAINLLGLIASFLILLFFAKQQPLMAGGLGWIAMSVIQLMGGILFIRKNYSHAIG